jgi:hypothetical protein
MMQEMFDAFGDYIEKKISEMHTAMPASIVSFNPATGLATVRPVIKYKTSDGRKIDYPDVSNVPVVIPQVSGCVIAFPVKPGDGCLLIVAEQSNDYWLYGQETDTDLKYDLSNAIAIVGLLRAASPYLATACANNELVLANGGSVVSLGSGGITISGNLTVTGTISAPTVKAGNVSLGSHTHIAPQGGGQTTGPT